MGTKKLIPGFRFHPTDVELLVYFLKRKVMGKKFRYDVIAEVEIKKYAPWDLPDKSYLTTGDLKWYFFCPREKKYASGARMNRATEFGYWKTTGRDRPVHHENRVVGMIKTLIFHRGRAPKGDRTNWVMHEFRLEDQVLADKGIPQDSYVLCKIFQKDGPGPRNGAQYGRPFIDEDWDDDEEEIDGVGSLPLIGVHAPITIDPNTPGSSTATHGHPPVPVVDDITKLLDSFTENDPVAMIENNIERNDNSAVDNEAEVQLRSDPNDIFKDLGDLDNTNQIYHAGSLPLDFFDDLDFLELRDLDTTIGPPH
ncbi:hypothetical protein QN277_025889 [Acacia crassicarpa]|uniref:NAC domain-containing protein n=1 Tax=Acacia crassicarpa TaxID=499986 RepID=A0AAE1MK28_9FABA|nr:hypothetical protein QN277_025889 [Acacia crassicarpa]